MDGATSTDSSITTTKRPNYPARDPGLEEYSPGDKPWNEHRAEAANIQAIYASADEFERYAERVADCSGILRFGWVESQDSDETALRLREAQFCRVRHCPVCQWRRSLMWQARFYQALPSIIEQYPKARWLYLTLTVRNCEIDKLGETLTSMNTAWRRFIQRKELRPVQGWLRSTEVTRGDDGSAHPHFHALLMVPPSMLSGVNYIKHSRWVELWQSCLRVGYKPNVDVRTIKPKAGDPESTAAALQAAVKETLKYSTKPADMTADEAWFLELTRQTRNRRFMASGGALKDVLKPDQETDDDLALAEQDSDEVEDKETPRLAFTWRGSERVYRRKPAADRYAD